MASSRTVEAAECRRCEGAAEIMGHGAGCKRDRNERGHSSRLVAGAVIEKTIGGPSSQPMAPGWALPHGGGRGRPPGLMNIHHLELFYYVARHGGISRAVQKMPYGIQQPAVSSQILQLEQDLGTKLFERNPFRLTPDGEELYAFVRPFFENLDAVASRLRKRTVPLLRLGASELVLRDHLPVVVERLGALQPEIRLALRSGYEPDLQAWVLDRQIDLAVTVMEGRPQPGIRCTRLMRLPLVLLVPRKSKIKSADQLWAQTLVEEPLISLPSFEPTTRLFQKSLQRRKVDWPTTIEASSLDMITSYVANGYGIGVSVALAAPPKSSLRVLPLDGFGTLDVVAMWRGEPTPIIRAVVEEGQRYVREAFPQWQCEDTLP